MNIPAELSGTHLRPPAPRRARRRTLAISVVFLVGIATILGTGAGLAVTPDTVEVTTEVINDTDGTDTSPFDLGSLVHDFVSVLTTGGSDIPGDSSVDFSFYTNGDCTTGTLSPPVENVAFLSVPMSPPVSANSAQRGPLPAGDYAYQVDFNSGLSSAVSDGVSACEPFQVEKAATETTTEVHDANHDPSNVIDLFGAVHDSATVTTDNTAGFTITGTVTYSFWTNFSCDGTATSTETVAVGTESTPQILGAGFFSYQATYNGDSNYLESTSPCEPFTVMPTIKSGSCSFDKDPDLAGQQLRLIFTPIPTTPSLYRLAASNPGQFYYNALVTGDEGEAFAVDITFPYPWVTQGSEPSHMFDGVSFHQADGKWCASPSGNGLGHDSDQVLLTDYSGPGDTETLTVNGTFDSTGLAYIRVHMDFDLKGTLPWTKSGTDAVSGAPLPAITINSPETWLFSDSEGGGANLQSVNVFKRDPGIAGLVLDQYGNPLAGVNVKIFDAKNVQKANLTTDTDGWYMWTMKYSGKTVTYTVRLPAYNLSQTITMAAKYFVIVNFTVTL